MLDFTGEMGSSLADEGRRKWTLLPADASSLELLRMIALICGGLPWLEKLAYPFSELVGGRSAEASVEALLELHPPRDLPAGRKQLLRALAVSIDSDGQLSYLKGRRSESRPPGVNSSGLHLGKGNRRILFLAYGPDFVTSCGREDFAFTDPWFRAERFRSLFESGAELTSAAAFLARLQYRVRKGRHPAKLTFAKLCGVLAARLGVPTGPWLEKGADLPALWAQVEPERKAMAVPLIDAVRHAMDASPHEGEPLSRPGALLFHRMDSICPAGLFPSFATAVHELFPKMQIICSLSDAGVAGFPAELRSVMLPAPAMSPPAAATGPRQAARITKRTILLAHIDGRLPNLALMKLATHFERQGRKVALARAPRFLYRGVEEVYASCVFHFEASLRRARSLRDHYGDRLQLGGSGIDLTLRLPSEIESLPAAYDLYPVLGGRGLGFLTRGCPAHCEFCIVPTKEGGVRQVAELDDLLEGDRRKQLILLDDNFFAFRGAEGLLEEMADREIAVNFNQTLDILRVTPERAKLLRRVRCMNARFTRDCYHFSLNGCRSLRRIAENYALLGFGPRDNVEFICMYGFDTTLAQDVERFRFLKTLPGAYVFVQEYRPIIGGPGPKELAFFEDRADALIDELIAILYRQNMKSMEKYYRWLSERYYEHFGKLHMPLVDTIFRYNQRERYGAYLASHPLRSRATEV